jgi:hypothetical protein
MAGRLYKLKGKSYPSSTTITGQLDKSGPLTYWAAGCAGDYVIDKVHSTKTLTRSKVIGFAEESKKKFRSVLQKAGDIGSSVHKAIEFYLKNDKEEPHIDDDKVLAGFVAFLEWADKHHLENARAEVTVYGRNYAGTLDCLCTIDGMPCILDFKTSKAPKNGKPYEEWRLQVASYRAAAVRMKLIPEDCKSGILRPDKETGYPDYYDVSDTHDADFEVFEALAKVWWLRHPEYSEDYEGAHLIGYGS